MTIGRVGLAIAVAGNAIYAIGGRSYSVLRHRLEGGNDLRDRRMGRREPRPFDERGLQVATDSWTAATPMPTARAEAEAAGHGGRIFIVGGARPAFGQSVDANEAFKP